MAVAMELYLSFNKEITKQPDPVPMSKMFIDLLVGTYFRACSTRCSDSGLGIRVDLLI